MPENNYLNKAVRLKHIVELKGYLDGTFATKEALQEAVGSGASAMARITVSLEAYVNDAKTAGADLNGLTVTLTNTTDQTTVDTQQWAGTPITFRGLVPLKDYSVSVQSVEGYTAPAAQAVTAIGIGEEVAKTFRYEADLYTVATNQSGSTVKVLSTAYGNGQTFRVAKGTDIGTPEASYVKGYSVSVTTTGKTITAAYSTTPVTIGIQSNQASDQTIAALTATVAWTYDGHSESETASNGESVNVPTGVTPTVTFPNAPTGYSRSVSGNTATYSTMILTVALTSDTGEADLSGVTKTVTDTTDGVTLTPQQDGTYKVPGGHAYSVSVSDNVEGYSAPAAQTGTAATTANAAITVTMTYEEAAGFVDLGLTSGTKWATGNLVKNADGTYAIGEETDLGCYVSWGNVDAHNQSEGYNWGTWDNSKNDAGNGYKADSAYGQTPGCSVSANIASNDDAHDIAYKRLGSPWHLPTKEQFKELYDETDREWVTNHNGVSGRNGYKFMKKTDHSVYVFFPAAGYGYGASIGSVGSYGHFWSSSWNSGASAYRMYFNSSDVYPQSISYRFLGFSVRAVQ